MAASSTMARIPRAVHAEITDIANENGLTFGEALQIWREQAASGTDTTATQGVSDGETTPKHDEALDLQTVMPDEVRELLEEVLANQSALMQGQRRGEAQRGLMTRVTLEGQQVIAETIKARDYNQRVYDAFSSTVAGHPELSGDSETFKRVMLQSLEQETELPALPDDADEEDDDAA